MFLSSTTWRSLRKTRVVQLLENEVIGNFAAANSVLSGHHIERRIPAHCRHADLQYGSRAILASCERFERPRRILFAKSRNAASAFAVQAVKVEER